ncbi:MAG: beta-lactamase family protein, partial [Actinomycetota bacterium]|nr:beta-lactamase family protein [Actinomycetota bacterium]
AGERYHYSNLAYGLLGELVARLEGASWWDVVESSLLRPLGLTETTYLPGAGAAVGTSRDLRNGRLMGEPAHDSGAMAPAGQLWSTVDDMAHWADFLAVGADAVLGAETLTQMRVARSADPLTQHRGAYGLGLRLRWRSESTLIGHTGSMPGFLAGLFVDPESRVGAAVLSNVTTGFDPERIVGELIDAGEPSLLEPASGQPSPLSHGEGVSRGDVDADELAGDWYWGNTPARLTPTDDGFLLTADAARRFVRVAADRYRGQNGYFAGEELRVVRRPDATISHFEVVTFVFTRTPYDPAAPIPGGLPEPL